MQAIQQSDLVRTASESLLDPAGLGESEIDKILSQVSAPAIDYADVYFQYSRHESWAMEEGIIKSGNYGIEQGVGVRAVSGEKTGFAYSDEFLLPALVDAADAARSIALHSGDGGQQQITRRNIHNAPALYQPLDPLASMSDDDKISLIREVEATARQADPRVSEVMVSLASVQDVIMVMRTDGVMSADIRPLMRMNVSVIVEQAGRREQGSAGGGGRYAYSYLVEQDRARGYAGEAVRRH